ncbi:MAG: hypothetical protein CVV64_01630 [Candidatus Wallbacteria bacterium HGW-Wallbacteria-1]|jgi:ABC-2 type transport system permease protein|uniref:Uncharacterized protein n=1 Tax=Candidatus Wallbacteria bacterium HGW-Wallbacteria-1 TaxID=2013854 RepID=A0A2N1PUX3_9BACT|nr:MAG: hypothetical protein CVV64_01630 [Candidatus Wallbacteria bacterium HGW-Wallbacteria-1]
MTVNSPDMKYRSRIPVALWLLIPSLRSALNRSRQAGYGWTILILGAVVLFSMALGWCTNLILTKIDTIPFIASTLKLRLLYMVFMSLFFMLSFSNLVTGLSVYFGSREVPMILSSPVSVSALGSSKLIETLIKSSWLTLLFIIPLFSAYHNHFIPRFTSYLYIAAALLLFLITITSIAVTLGILTARVFSAGHTRKFLQVIGAVTLTGLIFLVRALKPEEFMNPNRFASFASFMVTMDVPVMQNLPPRWLSDIVEASLTFQSQPWMQWLKLLSAALVAFLAAQLVFRLAYIKAWNRSQEILATDMVGDNMFNRAARIIEEGIGGDSGAIIGKELRIFTRNPAMWSQSFMILATSFVYFYNIYLLPFDASSLIYFEMPQLLSFLNIGFIGFILAAIAARFVYPAVSMEGKAWWILISSPVSNSTLYWSKFIFYSLPLIMFGLTLSFFSNRILAVAPQIATVSHANVIALALMIASLALTLGAVKPNFNEENIAGIPVSLGGLAFMILSMAVITGVLLLSAYPVIILMRYNFHFPIIPQQKLITALGFCGGWLTMVTAVLWTSTRIGINRIR